MEKEDLHPFESLHPIVLNAVLSKQLTLKLPGWGLKDLKLNMYKFSIMKKQFLIS